MAEWNYQKLDRIKREAAEIGKQVTVKPDLERGGYNVYVHEGSELTYEVQKNGFAAWFMDI